MYRTHANITRGLHTFYPLFEVHLCTVTFGLKYCQYSRVSNQERVMVARTVCLLENKNTLSERISTNCARCQRRKAIRKSSIFRVRPRRANELRLRMHTFRFNEKPVCTVLYGLELFSNFTPILITIVTLKFKYSEKTIKI